MVLTVDESPARRGATNVTADKTTADAEELDQHLRQELADAVEYQKASADILRIISAGPADIQYVFDAIVQAGQRLIPDSDLSIALVDGEEVKAVAFASSNPERAAIWKTRFPHPLNVGVGSGKGTKYFG